ncbi:hypothetical protein CRE_17866 [Caenorhabditis remanei]|uniref:Uncharacterized protein n=1 Tax=Caenorhabditis remanei TaxID=31234 RepID=E3MDS8_CAERE|nr:hypothetical protein CRE_17866 [Caenorhabditis remanei]
MPLSQAEADHEVRYNFFKPLLPNRVKEIKEQFAKLSEADKKTKYDKAEVMCNKFFESDQYKNGNRKIYGYGFCCELHELCDGKNLDQKFYEKTWFFVVCGVVGLLAVLGIIFAIWFCRKKMRNGKGSGGKDAVKN